MGPGPPSTGWCRLYELLALQNGCSAFLWGCLQEFGLASVLLTELGLETVVKLDAAATPGQNLSIHCANVDMGAGEYRLVAELVPAAA